MITTVQASVGGSTSSATSRLSRVIPPALTRSNPSASKIRRGSPRTPQPLASAMALRCDRLLPVFQMLQGWSFIHFLGTNIISALSRFSVRVSQNQCHPTSTMRDGSSAWHSGLPNIRERLHGRRNVAQFQRHAGYPSNTRKRLPSPQRIDVQRGGPRSKTPGATPIPYR